MELGRERDFEKNVFHDVCPIGHLELELFALGKASNHLERYA
jgi:hypothetical protein